MNLAEIEKIKSRMEFNQTESEIITKLVRNANIKGDSFQRTNKKIYKQAEKLREEINDFEQIIFTENDVKQTNFSDCCCVGIDGSHFPIGGIGGKWYVPYAIVRILYKKGIYNQPIVDVYDAGIDEINEQEDYNVKGVASLKMLVRETKALEDWADRKEKSIIFIDGPIIDPPSYKGKDYVKNRSYAIKKSIKKSMLIGCVKLSRDTFFISELEKLFDKKGKLNNFPSDQHLFAYLFSFYRKNGYNGFLFSKPIAAKDSTFEFYRKNGVNVFSFFFQKSIDSKILRLDIALLDEKVDNVDNICKNAALASSEWQYPKQFTPVPVELAHQKCTISEGTAQVLYEEIITRAHGTTVDHQIILNNLR